MQISCLSQHKDRNQLRVILFYAALVTAVATPIVAAGFSPQLAWRGPVYIVAGFAGIVAMSLLLIQPLLAGNLIPNLSPLKSRRFHKWIGSLLVLAVIVHVLGLFITSPPDVVDALLFRSPTPFAAWGVIAMWTLFAAAFLAATKQKLTLKLNTWRISHTVLAVVTAIGSVVHALLIEGTMELISKTILCTLVIGAMIKLLLLLRGKIDLKQ